MQNEFTIATWNVNSVRVRLPSLISWLKVHQPQLIALQETKVEDKFFPLDLLNELGYELIYTGQKSYNGVAFVGLLPFEQTLFELPRYPDLQRRIIATTVGKLRVINIYAPNGQSLLSPHYVYKLTWYTELLSFLKEELLRFPYIIILGDFNIAPEDRDVHAHWKSQILVSDPERAAFRSLLQLGFKDSFRLFNENAGYYSWWDYRSGGFPRNKGLRIDHILTSAALAPFCRSCSIDKTMRGTERPSDHVPVSATYFIEKL